MKKLVYILIALMAVSATSAQITLEATYSHSGTYTRLALSGYKYYVMDVGTSQCRIYNTNHTLWKTIALSVPVDNYLYDIKHVSENLFTTDNSLCLAYIYYSYNSAKQYYTYTARIIRENGTELLTIPGCQYIYIHSLTGVGTKMLTYSYDYSSFPYAIQTRAYNLPGQYITGTSDEQNPSGAWLKAFPNPAGDYTTIGVRLPEGVKSGVLTITDTVGKLLMSYAVDGQTTQLFIPTAQLPRGLYLYSVSSGSLILPGGKFIVQ